MNAETDEKTIELEDLLTLDTERQICTARFTPDGRQLVAGCYDSVIRRWDVTGEEPQPLEPLSGHHGWTQNVWFSPAGDVLYSADSWGKLCAWSFSGDEPKPLWQHEQAHDGWIRSLVLGDDAKLLATAGRDLMVRVWNALDGSLVKEFAGHEYDVYSVGLHPDGKSVVSGDLMGHLKHWDLAGGECVRETTLDAMHFYDRIQDVTGLRILRFRDGGETLVCAGSDPTKAGRAFGIPTIRLLDWKTLQEKKVWHLGVDKDGYIFDLHEHPDGWWAMVTSGPPGAGQLILLRPEEDEPCFVNKKLYNTHSLAVHFAGRRIAVSTTNRNSQGNGAVRDKEGKYVGNTSPLYFFELPEGV